MSCVSGCPVGALAVVGGDDRWPGRWMNRSNNPPLDDSASGVVHLETAHRLRGKRLRKLTGGVAGPATTRRPLLVRGRRSADAAPGDVGVDAPRGFLLCPEIDEEEVPLLDRRAVVRPRLVVGVGAVGVGADDGIGLGPYADLLEGIQDEALHRVLVDLVAAAQGVAHPVERLQRDPVKVVLAGDAFGCSCDKVARALREVGGGGDFDRRLESRP